jgi:hypothetical protein
VGGDDPAGALDDIRLGRSLSAWRRWWEIHARTPCPSANPTSTAIAISNIEVIWPLVQNGPLTKMERTFYTMLYMRRGRMRVYR